MTNSVEQQILDEVHARYYDEFLKYLGIDPEDFEDVQSQLEFDDCSQ